MLTTVSSAPAARSHPSAIWSSLLQRDVRVICIGLFAAVFAAFSPALRDGFAYDDYSLVTSNAHIRGGLTGDGLAYALTTWELGYPFPVTLISFMVDAQVFRMQPWGFHLVNILIHGANVILVFLLLRTMTGATWRSAAVALLLAVHPFRVEAVAWITERKTLLATFFGLLALMAYVRCARQPSAWTYAGVCALTLISLLAKPIFLPMPALMLLLDYWPLNRLRIGPSDRWVLPLPQGQGIEPVTLRRALLTKTGIVLIVVAASVYGYFAEQDALRRANSPFNYSLGYRACGAVVSSATYLWKTICFDHLSCYYPNPIAWPPGQVALASFIMLAITGLAVWQIRRRPWIFVGWCWYLAVLLPSSGLVTLGDFFMADRYTYLSSLGLIVMVVWSIPRGLAENRFGKPALLAAAGMLAVIFCVASREQSQTWHDNISLFEHAARQTPDNWMAEWQLLVSYTGEGDCTNALRHAGAAIRLSPGSASIHATMGQLLEKCGDLRGADNEYQRALQRDPGLRVARRGRAHVRQLMGLDQSLADLRRILANDPVDAAAHDRLGMLWSQAGRRDLAIYEFRRSIALSAQAIDAYLDLGSELLAAGRFQEAADVSRSALALNGRDPDANLNLAAALLQMGHANDAADHARMSLAARSGSDEAMTILGRAELQLGHASAALDWLSQARALNPSRAGLADWVKEAELLQRTGGR